MSKPHQSGIFLLGMAVSVVTLSSCGESGHVLEAAGKYVLVAAPADGGDDSAVGGTVRMVGDCLGIDDAVAIWPSGTSVESENPLIIKVPGEGRVEIGDKLEGAGGTLGSGDPPDDLDIPDTCASTTLVTYRAE